MRKICTIAIGIVIPLTLIGCGTTNSGHNFIVENADVNMSKISWNSLPEEWEDQFELLDSIYLDYSKVHDAVKFEIGSQDYESVNSNYENYGYSENSKYYIKDNTISDPVKKLSYLYSYSHINNGLGEILNAIELTYGGYIRDSSCYITDGDFYNNFGFYQYNHKLLYPYYYNSIGENNDDFIKINIYELYNEIGLEVWENKLFSDEYIETVYFRETIGIYVFVTITENVA